MTVSLSRCSSACDLANQAAIDSRLRPARFAS